MTRARDLADSADKDISGTLTLDDIVLSNDMTVADNGKVIFGAGSDLQIYHDGSHSYIEDSGTGNLRIDAQSFQIRKQGTTENMAGFAADGAVTLYYDNAVKLATTSTGITVTGDIANTSGDFTLDVAGDIILDADGAQIRFKDAGTEIGVISNSSNDLQIVSSVSDADMIFRGNDGGTPFNALTLDMSDAGTATFNHDIKLPDNGQAIFGAGSDLSIYHDGSNSFIEESGTGNLVIAGSTEVKIRNTTGGANLAVFKSTGVDVTGKLETSANNNGGAKANYIRITDTDTTATAANQQGGIEFYASDSSAGAGVTASMEVVYAGSGGGGEITFNTAANSGAGVSEAVRIDENGNVGIGTSSPNTLLELYGTTPFIRLQDDQSSVGSGANMGGIEFRTADSTVTGASRVTAKIRVESDATFNASDKSPSNMVFSTHGTSGTDPVDRVTIDSSGNVGIGTSSPTGSLHISSSAPSFYMTDTTNNTEAVVSTDNAGSVILNADLNNEESSSNIRFNIDGGEAGRFADNKAFIVGETSTANVLNGSGTYIGSNGQLYASTNSSSGHFVNRTGDGNVLVFRSAGNTEGAVNISGTTVSYNGGHLSRWSQLVDGSKDTNIVKGTVMTNLDKMAVWTHAAIAEGDKFKNDMGETVTATADDARDSYTEDNEQLNCMAVSSEEGDANVAGVFVNWDNDDDGFNDMNIAMTGDMVIRIAKSTTVSRGDLLMSAGDGTAKPQGDDIVRSKTIAKVTSTNVSHTYDDGSYVVPCVLMAC